VRASARRYTAYRRCTTRASHLSVGEIVAPQENRSVFGDLVNESRFVEPYLWTLDSLHRYGARATPAALLKEDES
jgi:hypothetical protein